MNIEDMSNQQIAEVLRGRGWKVASPTYAASRLIDLTQAGDRHVIALGDGVPTLTADLVSALEHDDTEVFVQIDPAAYDELVTDFNSGRTAYLYPIAVRIDHTGDPIIVVTTGDLAQSEPTEEDGQ